MTQLRRGGGIESQLMGWLSGLDRGRFAATLSLGYATDELEEVFRAAIPADVPVHVLGREPWLSQGRRLKLAGRLGWLGLLREEVLLPPLRRRVFRKRVERIAAGHDLVVDFDMSLARFARPAGKPLVAVSHFSLAHRLRANRRKLRAARRDFPRYDAILALSEAMREEGTTLFPELAPRFHTLYPGFDRAAIEARAAAYEPDLPAGPYLACVARLEETQKDFRTLLRAYVAVVARGAPERLVIVGDGRHRRPLEDFARSLGLAERVVFAGFRKDPLPIVSAASALVLSSRYEGLPTALIEGLMLGKVLVATDCPTGPREILDHGRAGLLVPVADADALADALGRALHDEPLRARLASAARAHSRTFDLPAFRGRVAALVDRLASPGPSAAPGC